VHRLHLRREIAAASKKRFARASAAARCRTLTDEARRPFSLDAVAPVEIGREHRHVLFRDRGVRVSELPSRPATRALGALGAAVQSEVGKDWACAGTPQASGDKSAASAAGFMAVIVTL